MPIGPATKQYLCRGQRPVRKRADEAVCAIGGATSAVEFHHGPEERAPGGNNTKGRPVVNEPAHILWSGREDSNFRPPAPHAGALPGCATPRRDQRIIAGSAVVAQKPANFLQLLPNIDGIWRISVGPAGTRSGHRGRANDNRRCARGATRIAPPQEPEWRYPTRADGVRR